MTPQKAVLVTLAYHDIFDYPPDLAQISKFLIGQRASLDAVNRAVSKLRKTGRIGTRKGYVYLKGRSKITNLRLHRRSYSKRKFKRVYFFAQILKIVPTLKLVAVSGALAMNNSHKDDDIDLVLITSAGVLWTTRFLATVLLLPFKRDPQGKKIADRACLNIFIDEADLRIRPQNLYTAHEIAQMKPICDRDGTYAKFIKANLWIKKFLPNWQADAKVLTANDQRPKKSHALIFKCLALAAKPLEALARWGQLFYMRSKITTEKIGKTQLFFHPADTQKRVMAEYQKRLKNLQ